MKYTKLLVQRFLSSMVCTGKTTSMINQARKEIANGKKVAIIIEAPGFIYHYKDLGADVYSLHTLLKWLKDDSCAEPTDYACVYWKHLPQLKDYDFVYIDPACYERIIRTLMDKLDTITKEKQILLKGYNKLLNTIDEEWEKY